PQRIFLSMCFGFAFVLLPDLSHTVFGSIDLDFLSFSPFVSAFFVHALYNSWLVGFLTEHTGWEWLKMSQLNTGDFIEPEIDPRTSREKEILVESSLLAEIPKEYEEKIKKIK